MTTHGFHFKEAQKLQRIRAGAVVGMFVFAYLGFTSIDTLARLIEVILIAACAFTAGATSIQYERHRDLAEDAAYREANNL